MARGKPSKYNDYIKPYLALISEYCQTMTEKQIAAKMGVSYSAWNQYKIDYPELKETIKKGRQNLVAELRSTLIKKALGYEYTEIKEITTQVKWDDDVCEKLLDAGLTLEEISNSRLIKTEKITKTAQPDVAAINLLLKNYDKENWANDPQMISIREKELELRERQIDNNAW